MWLDDEYEFEGGYVPGTNHGQPQNPDVYPGLHNRHHKPPIASQLSESFSESDGDGDDGLGDVAHLKSVKHGYRDVTWRNFTHCYNPS